MSNIFAPLRESVRGLQAYVRRTSSLSISSQMLVQCPEPFLKEEIRQYLHLVFEKSPTVYYITTED